jgi:hypothetical protein
MWTFDLVLEGAICKVPIPYLGPPPRADEAHHRQFNIVIAGIGVNSIVIGGFWSGRDQALRATLPGSSVLHLMPPAFPSPRA